jgi:hypothetical protein
MNLKQAFVAAATVAVAGFGTSVALACDDRGLIDHQRPPIVQLADSQPGRSAELAGLARLRRPPGPRHRRFGERRRQRGPIEKQSAMSHERQAVPNAVRQCRIREFETVGA